MRRYGSEIAISVLLFGMTLAVFGRACSFEFVTYDDRTYVTENPWVKAGLSGQGLWWAFTTFHAANWHPLTWLSLQTDAQLFGPAPWGYHLNNVLLHAANTLLLFWLLRLMPGRLWPSAVVAALFAVHPLHVESVAWVSERKDVLSTLFWLLALAAYAWYARQPGVGRYLLVVAAFVLGLLAKPMLVTVPFVLLLLDYWPLRRAEAKAPDAAGALSAWRPLVLEKLPLFALSACSCVITWYAQRQGQAIGSLEIYPLEVRLGNALVSYVAYIGKALWPVNLAAFYPHPERVLSGWQLDGAFFVLAAVSLLVAKAQVRRPYLAVGWLWYLGTLVPVIGLVQVGEQARADRYTYVPLVGLFLMASWGVADLAQRWQLRRAAFALVVVVLVLCSVCSMQQLSSWRDSVALWEHAIAATGGSRIAHNNLGGVLLLRGDLDGAIRHYVEALRFDPEAEAVHYNLGNALQERGDLDGAIRHYVEALRLNPNLALVHSNLGLILQQRGEREAALRHHAEALRLNPKSATAYYNLGISLQERGDLDGAIRHYTEALQLAPDFMKAHSNLGLALHLRGELEEAIRHYTQALQLDPKSAPTHYNLGKALQQRGDLEGAVRHFGEAVRLQPKDTRCHCSLAFALYERGQKEAALAQYREATRLDPGWLQTTNKNAWALATHAESGSRNGPAALELAQQVCQATAERQPLFLDTLAAAYAEVGRFPEAVAAAQKALALASGGLDRQAIEGRLRLYENRQPFRSADK